MKNICLLFGGDSAEHDVSIMSAKNVFEAIDKSKFAVYLVYQLPNRQAVKVSDFVNLNGELVSIADWEIFDVVLPIMHGPNCEDGNLQGFLHTLRKPFMGPSTLSSAVCMDKDFQKQIARFNGLNVADWVTIKKHEYEADTKIAEDKIASLGWPLYVKPSAMGSSIGVTKVNCLDDLDSAIKKAFEFGDKIVIEQEIKGRELEVAVLGKNDQLIISPPGEILTNAQYAIYDYTAKYMDPEGAIIHIPAPALSIEKLSEFEQLSRQIYNLFECQDLSRIDYFLAPDGTIYLNEINTLPGFTDISMYPKLMAEVGISYSELITRLIEFNLPAES